jgi:DNA-binding transcriptional LysR family regulator
MKIQLLYEFISLSEMLNFTKTAQKMNITQPVLSRHMKNLEEQFGADLFRRDTHGVELTTSGQLLFHEARKITTQYESSISLMNSFTGKSRRKLTITFLGEALQRPLVEFLNHFKALYPDIAVDCRDSELDEALSYLDDQTCDLGFLIRPSFVENVLFDDVHIQTDAICVAVNRHHPLARRSRISLREIEHWPVIRIDPGHFALSHEYSTEFLDKYNIPYRLEKEYPNLKTCCFNLEFNQQAVMLMPRHREYLLSDNCVLLDVIEDDYWFELEVVWDRKNPNPSIQLFINEFRKFSSNMTPVHSSKLETLNDHGNPLTAADAQRC